MKKITTSISQFGKIIDGGYLYADKTKYVHDLLTSDENSFFLSRPRRFGKTLLISTLKDLFTNGGDRFKDLWIGRSGYQIETRPVVYLSLSQESSSPEILEKNLLVDLHGIASEAGLGQIEGETPAKYFGKLIEKLHKTTGRQVAVLIDEYDAPVTDNMADRETAQANARVLHRFFATLKIETVAASISFTLVTGITRYALTSMDSGANHLKDISLEPKYAGICGITVDEFDDLFADRMETALAGLKSERELGEAATLKDLRALIFRWYDGYDWGGGTRILNPFSILNFFQSYKLTDYWVTSGRPGHLSAMLQAHPENFVPSKFESYANYELRKTELTGLEPVPVLFHSGYLTLDGERRKVVLDGKLEKAEGKNSQIDTDFYCFRFPNHEVSRYFNATLFRLIFKPDRKGLSQAGELREALLDRDAVKVGQFFMGHFSRVTFHQKPNDEKTFHALVQVMFSAMGFDVQSELPGAVGRLDLILTLPNNIRVIIELKYIKNELTANESNKALAELAKAKLSVELRDELLAQEVMVKFGETDQRLMDIDRENLIVPERNKRLAQEAPRLLPKTDIDAVFANQAKSTLSQEVVGDALKRALERLSPSEETINSDLLKAAQQALTDINNRKYATIISGTPKNIIKLGMAGFGNLVHIKALFE
ncbi:MAG: ATP-binding protein [Deltaproteobacteria bacterium]|nr:ATP-binding protein [Deltaproteobacteria bacterium]